MSGTPPEPDELPEPDEQPKDVESIQDPNEYALRRRLAQILDARQAVTETRRKAREGKLQAPYEAVVASAVCDYAVELEPLIRQAGVYDELEWPGVMWPDLDAYLERGGMAIKVKEERVNNSEVVADPADSDIKNIGSISTTAPPRGDSMQVWRHLNACLAELGLDVTRAEDTPLSRY